MEIVAEAHDAFQRPITKPKCANVYHYDEIQAYVDSGAQTCACGLDALHSLGLDETDLKITSHCILGVTSTAMDIVGVFLAKLSVDSACTRQVVYVSRNSTGVFLSHGALRQLGSLQSTFPSPQNSSRLTSARSSNAHQSSGPYGCPCCTAPPPKPDTIPFDPVDKNVHKLEGYGC